MMMPDILNDDKKKGTAFLNYTNKQKGVLMYKLLIVDDEYEMRNGLEQYFPFNDIGFSLIGSVENGKQALEIIIFITVIILIVYSLFDSIPLNVYCQYY